MHRKIVSPLLIVFALIAAPELSFGGYSPTRTEINLGPVPLDLYTSPFTNATLGYILPTSSCPGSYTIRECYKLYFNNNSGSSPYTSGNYIAQGVTGVRFFFGLGSTGVGSTYSNGFYSSPWDSMGTISSTWVTNLSTFLSDLHGYGVTYISFAPAMDGWAGIPITPATNVYDCTGSTPLVFYPWMPFGHLSTNDYYPDCQLINSGYSSANANPYFWGWTPMFTLVGDIFGAISSSGLTLAGC